MLLIATGFSNVAEDSEIGMDFNPATSLSAHPRLTTQTFWDYEQPEASSVFGLFSQVVVDWDIRWRVTSGVWVISWLLPWRRAKGSEGFPCFRGTDR